MKIKSESGLNILIELGDWYLRSLTLSVCVCSCVCVSLKHKLLCPYYSNDGEPLLVSYF